MEDQEITIPIPKEKRKSRFIYLIIFVVLAGILFVAFQKFSGSSTPLAKIEISPAPTEFQFPTDTPTPSVLTSPTEEPSPTEKPKTSTDKTSGLERAELSINVQNGSGEALVASKMSDFLKGLGYHVVAIGNADNFNYENITVQVKPGFSEYLSLLKSDLSSEYTVGDTSSDLSASSSADAVVIIGN